MWTTACAPKFFAQPGVERQVGVRRRQVRIVIAGARIDVVAARRLDPDDDVAERQQSEAEGAVRDMRIILGSTPALPGGRSDRLGQALEEAQIVVDRQAHADLAAGARGQIVGDALEQRLDQRADRRPACRSIR